MGLGLAGGVWAAERPNIVVLVASGVGWEEAESWRADGALGALARLRDGGVSLRRFHGNPVAAPGHAELLTGRHFLRNGVSGNDDGEQLLHELEITVAEVCQAAGYRTGFFGWWRHGGNVPQHPLFQGFEVFAGRCRAVWREDEIPWIQRGLQPETAAADPWQAIASDVIEFASSPGTAPYLCWICVPPGEQGLAQLDSIADALRQIKAGPGPERSTLTILVSDQPGANPEGKLFGSAGTLSEGGVRIPGFWCWPGVIEPGLVIHEIAQNVDLFPTVAALAEGKTPKDRTIDGMNLLPLLLNQAPPRWPNRDISNAVVLNRNPATTRTSFRTTNWLAVRDPTCRRNPRLPPGETWELFDLQADPLQRYEVGETYPFVLARLKSDFCRWHLDASQIDLSPVPLAVGRPDVSETRMLAEFADRPESGSLRWQLRTPTQVEVEVCWRGDEGGWEPAWKLRLGGVELGDVPIRGRDVWSLGPVSLPSGKIEARVSGVPADFAKRGELILRAVNP